jgi:hypothetical protein
MDANSCIILGTIAFMMPMPTFIGRTRTRKSLYFMPLSRLSNWPRDLQLESKYVRLFVACDARRLQAPRVRSFASQVIKQRVVNLSVWGPKCCEGFHIPFVEALDQNTSDSALIITNCNRDSLREALSFFIEWGYVSKKYESHSNSLLFVPVGNPVWRKSMRQSLAAYVGPRQRRRRK